MLSFPGKLSSHNNFVDSTNVGSYKVCNLSIIDRRCANEQKTKPASEKFPPYKEVAY